MEQPAAADDGFAENILQSYARQLFALATEQLDSKLKCKLDPEDIVQSTLKSFFRRSKNLDLSHESQETLWDLLALITIRKCRKWETQFFSDKRDVFREVACIDESESVYRDLACSTSAPTAEDALVAAELLEQLLRNFTQRQQEMILLRVQGLSAGEVATACTSSVRTVARTIAKAKQILADLILDD